MFVSRRRTRLDIGLQIFEESSIDGRPQTTQYIQEMLPFLTSHHICKKCLFLQLLGMQIWWIGAWGLQQARDSDDSQWRPEASNTILSFCLVGAIVFSAVRGPKGHQSTGLLKCKPKKTCKQGAHAPNPIRKHTSWNNSEVKVIPPEHV